MSGFWGKNPKKNPDRGWKQVARDGWTVVENEWRLQG